MPLPMKTLREAAMELGMPESEIKVMIDLRKIRAVWKKNQLTIAPDEIAKIRRLRKTLPESEQRASASAAPAPTAPSPAAGSKPAPGARPATAAKPAPTPTRVKAAPVKLPPPPPQ